MKRRHRSLAPQVVALGPAFFVAPSLDAKEPDELLLLQALPRIGATPFARRTALTGACGRRTGKFFMVRASTY